MEKPIKTELERREYQIELFDLAVEKNIILYLPTGSGKTYIATLLIKHFCNRDKDKIDLPINIGGKRAFFIVNTVALVEQQQKQIASQTTLVVGQYSGNLGVDLWDDTIWANEINSKHILVMTCQIFVDLVQKSRLSLENVNLLVFDECHRAVANHPMRQAMQLFVNLPPDKRPRVLGLTATLLNGNVKASSVQEELRYLEITFMAKIETSSDEETVKLYSTNPVESKVTYEENCCDHPCYNFCSNLMKEMKELLEVLQIEDGLPIQVNVPKNSYQICSNSQKTNKKLKNLIEDIDYNLKTLGMIGGSLAVLAHLVQIQQMLPNVQQETTRIILQQLTTDFILMRKYFEVEMDKRGLSELGKLRTFSPDKARKLFSILKKVNESDSAIVFVQRRFSAKVLYYLVNKASKLDPDLKHIKCNFVVGYNVGDPFKDTRENYLQRKQNTKVMRMFNEGELNVLFASNVVEEGVDITKCNFVIMFDTVLDFRAYVQSKGRARDRNSNYIMMVSKSDSSFSKKFESFHETESALQQTLYGGKSRSRTAPTEQELNDKLFTALPGLETYSPKGPKGPIITALSAVSTINRYFASLILDKFTKVNHYWFIEKEKSGFICYLQLPMEARNPALIKSTLQPTVENAKRSAALEACKILHKNGDLGDNDLLPIGVDVILNNFNFTPNVDESEDFIEIIDEKPVKLGTKKNKRLCLKKWADCLSGCAPEPNQIVYLHILEVLPKYKAPGMSDNHRLWMVHHLLSLPNQFAILSSKKIPKLATFPLYMSTGELEVRIHQGTKLILSVDEYKFIADFHFLIFDSVLEVAKKFMMQDFTNTQNSYLIAPVLKENDTIRIDWDVIKESNKTFPSATKPTSEERLSLKVTDETYFGKIVTPWYRTVPAQKYIVTKVCYDMTENTQFPTDNYDSYKEYFQEKYKIEPLLKDQPLLEVRAISSRLNSTKPRALTKQLKRKNKDENEEFEVWLLPEFCVVYPLHGRYWLKAQLLPSILHRVSQLCLAEELRCNIASYTGIGAINHSSQWKKLEEDVSLKKSKDSDEDMPQALKPLFLSNNLNTSLSKEPDLWGLEEEPVDIERSMESATIFDIYTYETFNKKPLVSTLTGSRAELITELTGSAKNYETKMVEPPPLAICKNGQDGPEQVDVLQALIAAVANDFVNCERLETLGDSFLKFATSVILFETEPDLQEGHLTNIKGQIVGNKNLYFCGKKKNIEPLLGTHAFSPKEDWVPPGFHVPHPVQGVIRTANLSVNCLYDVVIPDNERKSRVMTSTTQSLFEDALLNKGEESLLAQNCSFTNQLAYTDKNVSDAVEAILGTYLKSNGILGALDVMNWFGVTDSTKSTHEVFSSKPMSAARGSGNVNAHLQQPHHLESILGYQFKDRSFLLQALTHPSYTRNNITKCYQRLEFLGDALIDFLITIHIFEKCKTLTPGDLTDLRSALVNNITLACISVRNHFYKFLLYHSSILNDYISRFVKNQEERNHLIDHDVLFLVEEQDVNIAEAVEVPKALGDIFEALVGAIYLDSGKNLDVTWKVIYNLMREEIENFSKDIPKNHVRMLYESKASPVFKSTIERNGVVMVSVEINHNDVVKTFSGFGDNKKQAQRAAAKHGLRYIRSTLNN